MATKAEISVAFEAILGRQISDNDKIDQLLDMDIANIGKYLRNTSEYLNNTKSIEATGKWVAAKILKSRYLINLNLADKFVSFGCLIDNYEPYETEVFRRAIDPLCDVVDVGTNIGWYTFNALEVIGSEARVHGVEANTIVYNNYIESIRLNQLFDRVSAHNCAAGDIETEVTLGWHEQSKNLGSASIGNYSDQQVINKVKMFPLDMLVPAARKVGIIKIDIEGAELLALKGANRIIQRDRPKIILEFNPSGMEAIMRAKASDLFD